MYGKIFASIYEGTLYGQWEALVTFQQLIVLCDADGIVDMTPPAIAGKTSIPLHIIEKGISVLESPDKYSRSPEQEGRRIELIDAHRPWGWHIVNHQKYQQMKDVDTIREQTRERVRRHRESKKIETEALRKNVTGNADVTDGNAPLRYTDTDTDTDKATAAYAKLSTAPPPSPPSSDSQSRAEIIAARLRKLEAGRKKRCTITAKDPRVLRWVEAGISDPQLREAYEMAVTDREANADPGPVNAGFLDVFIAKLLNQPGASSSVVVKPWHETASGIEAKGSELGIEPPTLDNGGFPAFKARVFAAAGLSPGRAAA